MGSNSKIEWTDATWTPIRAQRWDNGKIGVHCERVSEGCKNCYAAAHNKRNLPVHGTGLDFTILNREKVDIFVGKDMLMAPMRWKRPRRIFVCSQTDLFGEFVSDDMIDRVFAVMAICEQHTFQVLTKRPGRMREYLSNRDRRHEIGVALYNIPGDNHHWTIPDDQWPLPNVWIGVTAENQARADERIPLLLQTPAAKRFVSVEPMLGPVDLQNHPMFWQSNAKIDWVICGGESGHGARPMHPDWVRSLRDQCQAAAVPFLFKQWGEWAELPALALPRSVRNNRTFNIALRKYAKEHGASELLSAGHLLEGVRESCILEKDKALGRVGKKAAGRLLDGVEWNQFPEVKNA